MTASAVDVTLFGIEPDDSSDQASVLNDFFDWCLQHGKTATAPAGTFLLHSSVTMTVSFKGAGPGLTVFKLADGLSDSVGLAMDVIRTPVATDGNDDLIVLEGFTADGNKDNNDGWPVVGSANYGVAVRSRKAIVRDVECRNVTANGLGVPAYAADVKFHNVWSHHNGKKGLHSGLVGRISVTGSSFHDNEIDAGIGFHQGATDLVISGNHCWDNAYGIYVGGSLTNTASSRAVISGNVLTGNSTSGIYVNGFGSAIDSTSAVTGNVLDSNTYGLSLAGCRSVIVSDNIVTATEKEPVRLFSCHDTTVSGNVLSANATAARVSAIRVYGFAQGLSALSTCRAISVVGNVIRDTGSLHAYGIAVDGDSRDVLVTGNIIEGITAASCLLNNASAPGAVHMDGNICGSGGLWSAFGSRSGTLPPASAAYAGQTRVKTGDGAEDKVCVCVLSANGSTYKWINVVDGATVT